MEFHIGRQGGIPERESEPNRKIGRMLIAIQPCAAERFDHEGNSPIPQRLLGAFKLELAP